MASARSILNLVCEANLDFVYGYIDSAGRLMKDSRKGLKFSQAKNQPLPGYRRVKFKANSPTEPQLWIVTTPAPEHRVNGPKTDIKAYADQVEAYNAINTMLGKAPNVNPEVVPYGFLEILDRAAPPVRLYAYLDAKNQFLTIGSKVKAIKQMPQPIRGYRRGVFTSGAGGKLDLWTILDDTGQIYMSRTHWGARTPNFDWPAYATEAEANKALARLQKNNTNAGFTIVPLGLIDFLDSKPERRATLNKAGVRLWTLANRLKQFTIDSHYGKQFANFPDFVRKTFEPIRSGGVKYVLSLTPTQQTQYWNTLYHVSGQIPDRNTAINWQNELNHSAFDLAKISKRDMQLANKYGFDFKPDAT